MSSSLAGHEISWMTREVKLLPIQNIQKAIEKDSEPGRTATKPDYQIYKMTYLNSPLL